MFMGCEPDGDSIYLPQQDETSSLNNSYNIIELSSNQNQFTTDAELIATIDIEMGSEVNSFWLEVDFFTDSSHETKIATKKVAVGGIPLYETYTLEISIDSTHNPNFSIGNFNAWYWSECLCVNEP